MISFNEVINVNLYNFGGGQRTPQGTSGKLRSS